LRKRVVTRSAAGCKSLLPISTMALWSLQGRVVTRSQSKPTDGRTVAALLYPRGQPLSCDARIARHGADRQAQPSQGSIIFACRPHLLSERPHLPRPGGATAGLRHISLCLASVGLPLPRLIRNRRQSRRSVPRHRPRIANLSAHVHSGRGAGHAADRRRDIWTSALAAANTGSISRAG